MNRLGDVDGYTGFFVEWIEQYSQFFTACNWYDFDFVHMQVEDDRCMGGVEVRLVVLGLGFRARWNYAVTEKVGEIKESVADLLKKHGLEA